MKDAALIERFGTAEALAAAVGEKSGVSVSRSAVYEWKRKGIPARWRRIVASLADEQGVPLPRGFEPKPKAQSKQRAQSAR